MEGDGLESCTLFCDGHPILGKREEKEAQRIETEMIMGMERSSAMADAQFEKKANKIIESIKVHGMHE